MKKLFFLLAILPLLIACDKVDENDRYIETGPVEVSRKVLLEEFTGQRCINCPDAHKIIENLESQYGDALIAVSIHAGVFSIKAPRGLSVSEGEVYAEHWNISDYPSGVVDQNSGVLGRDAWATAIRDDITKPTDLQLALEAQLSEDQQKIEVFTTLVSSADLEGSLQLWVVESDIVASQVDGSVTIPDYVHNNVFRACVNGQWGVNLPLSKNVVKYESNTVDVNPLWNLSNVAIVGFYYNSSGVVQVERCKLMLENNNDE